MNWSNSTDSLRPPSANPTKYCRFCYSQFRIEPLFAPSEDKNRRLLDRIHSLVQIRLDAQRDAASAICHMCLQKLTEFEMFRDRCQRLDEAVRKCRPFPTLELQLEEVRNESQESLLVDVYEEEFVEEEGGQLEEESRLCVSIKPLDLGDFEQSEQEDSFEQEANETTVLNGTISGLNATQLTVVTNASEDRKNYRFWLALTRDVYPIPVHVRHGLELTGKCRDASLGLISPSTIKRIEESLRKSVDLLVSQEALLGTDSKQAMIKYYGKKYCENPEQFSFSQEEKDTILEIAAMIQQKGIRPYLKAAKLTTEKREPVDYAEEKAAYLVTKIQLYYQARNSQTEQFQQFFNRLPTIKQCNVYKMSNGRVYASIQCKICRKSLKATLKGNYWNYFSFIHHNEVKHYQVEMKADRSRCKVSAESTPKKSNLRSRAKSVF